MLQFANSMIRNRPAAQSGVTIEQAKKRDTRFVKCRDLQPFQSFYKWRIFLNCRGFPPPFRHLALPTHPERECYTDYATV